MKRKVRVHGKIDLMETSAVGLPAYPYAHASANSDSFSLVKTLTLANMRRDTKFVEEKGDIGEPTKVDEQNLEEKKEAMEGNSEPEATEKEAKTETEKSVEVEKKVEEGNSMTAEIAKAIADGVKKGLKEFETERGVVDKAAPVKAKSLGEIALGMHNKHYQDLSVED
jgi:hypothetical protein